MTIAIAALIALAAQDEVEWATDWDAALAEAKARNVPIQWTVHQDG